MLPILALRQRCRKTSSSCQAGRSDASKDTQTAVVSRDNDDEGDATTSPSPGGGNFAFIASVAALITFGVANRVLYKMALVPMGDYVFFLAQFQTFGYCVVYFSALAFRKRSGIVSEKQLKAVPLKLFAGVGAIEAVSQVLGFIGASKLPGVLLPLLSQSVMFWNLTLSKFYLKKNLLWQQIAGAVTVVAGVIIAAFPVNGGPGLFSGVPIQYVWIFVASMGFPALDNVIKEKIFKDVKQDINEDLDIFVVNSFASGFQAVGVLLLLPLLASLRGIGITELPSYLLEGFNVFMGLGSSAGNGAPLLPILYVGANLAFNISALLVLRTSGALANSLAIAALTPLTIFLFSFSLPYLGDAPTLGPNFILGSAVLVAGLLTYNSPSLVPQIKERFGK